MAQPIAKAGSLLSIESGEYSDYSVHGFFVVLRDFSPLEMRDQLMASRPPSDNEWERERLDAYEFIPYLIAQGVLLAVDYHALWVGAYGRASDMTLHGGGNANE